MLLGLDSYSYHLAFGAHPDFSPRRKLTLFEFIAKVRALGLDGFQIDPMHLASRSRAHLAEVRAAAAAAGLFLEHGAIGLDPAQLRRELEVCVRLSSPVLRTFAGFNRHDPRTNVAAEIRRAIANLKKIRPVAAGLGVKIAVENHGDLTTDELLQVIRAVDSPWIGICLDVGNPMLTLEEPLPAVEKMAPYAFTTHVKDYALEQTNYGAKISGVALGDGYVDLPAVLKVIRTRSPLDRIILEIPIEARSGASARANLDHEDDCVCRSVLRARALLRRR